VPELLTVGSSSHLGLGNYDRLAFNFKTAAAPGYQSGFVDKVVRTASGMPIDLPGQAFLQIDFNPAQASNQSPDPVKANLQELQSYVMNGNFENHLTFALGLASKTGYKITELHDVQAGIWTINVDIQHP
jgi:hypothetical protein